MNVSENVKDRLIFALDVPSRTEAVRFVQLLEGYVGCFKVGLELFIKEGPSILQAVKDHSSAPVFLDLKLHDIPATVASALESAADLGARFITVHACDGEALLKTSATVRKSGLGVLAVTVLTHVDANKLPGLGYREGLSLKELVIQRAEFAKNAGCAGVVCSGEEAQAVRERCGPDFTIVVPGIRPAWSLVAGDDQTRITTPKQAIERGADHIVVGRPIRTAKDPVQAARKILEEIAG